MYGVSGHTLVSLCIFQMVLQFPDNCVNCGLGNNKKSDVERFVAKYLSLNVNERLAATTTDQSEIAEQLACLVPCVGCRKR